MFISGPWAKFDDVSCLRCLWPILSSNKKIAQIYFFSNIIPLV